MTELAMTWRRWLRPLELPVIDVRWQALSLVVCSMLPTALLYLQHTSDFSAIIRYWDGPNYIEVAKTLYDVPVDHPFVEEDTTPAYFACHLPLYPVLIRLFAPLFGYAGAMLFVTIVSAALATLAFWRLLIAFECVENPWFSALIFTIVPARWIIYKSVGATEPLFLLCVFSSLIAYKKDRFALALVCAGLASMTRIVGVFMAFVYFVDLLRTQRWTRVPWLACIGLPLLATFTFYHFQYGDFWAYLSWNSELLGPWPMTLFGTIEGDHMPHSNELFFILYCVYGLGVLFLWKQRLLFVYAATYYVFTLFVQHEDIARYFLAMGHVALIVGYDRIFSTPQFRAIAPVVLLLGVAHTRELIPANTASPETYERLLKQPERPLFGAP